MAKSRKKKLLPQAQALYAEGSSKEVIAEVIHVSVSTVRRWARQDAAAGRPWERDPALTFRPAGARRTQPSSQPPPERQESTPSAPSPSIRLASGGLRAEGGGVKALADRLCRKLEERLESLIEDSPKEIKDSRLEDHMLKIYKVLDFVRAGRDDVGTQLMAMKRFAGFCLQNLSEQEMTPVRKAIRLFVEELRRKHQ